MGQDKSNPFREDGELMSAYQIGERNPQLGLTYLRHRRSNRECLLRELTFNELREFNLNGDKLKLRSKVKHKNVTALEVIEQRKDDHLCSNYYKLYTLWEYPRRTLADQIAERSSTKRRFDNQQLRVILESVVSGMAALQQSEVRHESLTTKTILFDQNRTLKIADPNCTGVLTNMDALSHNRGLKNIYLSPEQCQSIETQKPILKKNPYRSDVFTFGVVMLECGLMQAQNECYLDDCSRIMWDRIGAGLGQFAQIYDPFLTKIVELSLMKDSNGRPDWIVLSKHFAKDYYQFSNTSEFPSQTTLKNGIQLVRQSGLESQPSAFSYQPTKVYAGQEPTFTKYLQSGPGTLAMIPSVSNQGSSMYSQRISPHGHAQMNPSHVLQTSYSNFSSIPGNSVFLPVGGSAGTSYYNPAGASQRQTQTMSNRVYQEKSQMIPVHGSNPVQIPAVSSASLPSNFVGNNMNFGPVPSINQGEGGKEQEPGSNHHFHTTLHNLPPIPTEKIEERPKFTLPSSAFQYKSVFNNSEYMNYSPIISNYIRPAESISYEANRVPESTSVKQLDDSKPNQGSESSPFDLNLARPADNLDSSASDQPQYVQQYFKLGSRYEGYKLNGMRHGKGKFYYQDGGSYDGEWKQNKMNGYGVLYYQSNSIAYEGQWVNDRFQGFGKLYNENPVRLQEGFDYTNFDDIQEYWQFYEGDFTDDLKNGQGRLKFSNGEVFEGGFREDMVQGVGVFTRGDGQRVKGSWSENHLQS